MGVGPDPVAAPGPDGAGADADVGAEAEGEADVVVVGGGPAGAATAIWCALADLRVVVLERRATPLDRPGESLHPGIEPLLARLGAAEGVAAAGFPRHAGHWVTWGAPPRFVPFGSDAAGPWLGFQAHRATLDRLLLGRAEEAGARIVRPVQPVRPLVEEGRVVGVALVEGELRAPVVVDAAGGRHWLARHLALAVDRCSPRLVARYGYRTGDRHGPDPGPAIVADEHGWTWTACVGDGRFHWTRLDLVEDLGAAPRPGRSADVTWRVVPDSAGPGWFLVGDAAAVLDPASSHGVLRAVMSGMQAAHLIRSVRTGRADEAACARSYREWLLDWFHHDEALLRSSYRNLPSPPAWVGAGSVARPTPAPGRSP